MPDATDPVAALHAAGVQITNLIELDPDLRGLWDEVDISRDDVLMAVFVRIDGRPALLILADGLSTDAGNEVLRQGADALSWPDAAWAARVEPDGSAHITFVTWRFPRNRL